MVRVSTDKARPPIDEARFSIDKSAADQDVRSDTIVDAADQEARYSIDESAADQDACSDTLAAKLRKAIKNCFRKTVADTSKNPFNASGNKTGEINHDDKDLGEKMSGLSEINRALETRLPINDDVDTSRVVGDHDGEFVIFSPDGLVKAKRPAFLGVIPTNQYSIGLGGYQEIKYEDKYGKCDIYRPVIMIDRKNTWNLPQWTSNDVVVEGVPLNISNSTDFKAGRGIGHKFVRIGLPKKNFGPIFETVGANYPKILDSVSGSLEYYWVNASWGAKGQPATCEYATGPGKLDKTNEISNLLRMLSGNSSKCTATVAISIALRGCLAWDNSKRQNKVQYQWSNYEFRITLHNVLHMQSVTDRSPTLKASGFEVTKDMLEDIEYVKPK